MKIFVVGTITMALKARDKLKEHSIMSTVKRTQSGGFGIGCGYGVVVTDKDAEKCRKHLFAAGIKILSSGDFKG